MNYMHTIQYDNDGKIIRVTVNLTPDELSRNQPTDRALRAAWRGFKPDFSSPIQKTGLYEISTSVYTKPPLADFIVKAFEKAIEDWNNHLNLYKRFEEIWLDLSAIDDGE